ncbi:MAG: helix-turn-helix domain-containing protein [Prolixibacteraceae bacterium]|jgi:AraC-like DNA-binding protein
MKIEDFPPTDILKPFIKTYRIIESQEELENRVLPNTSLAIAFRFKGVNAYNTGTEKIHLPGITFSGLRKSVRLINYSKNTSTLIVLFKEYGASAFFREPLHELFEKSISLDCIIHPNELAFVEELLTEAENNSQRVAIVEQFLLRKINHFKPDSLVLAAVSKIKSAKGLLRIKELTDELYISNDAFEKRFRKAVGSTPKQFASIVRMSYLIQHKTSERLLDIVFDAGYYDQSHFSKDFKIFTGLTPTEFYKSAAFW